MARKLHLNYSGPRVWSETRLQAGSCNFCTGRDVDLDEYVTVAQAQTGGLLVRFCTDCLETLGLEVKAVKKVNARATKRLEDMVDHLERASGHIEQARRIGQKIKA